MPLWHIYGPEKAYSAEDKCAFATRITDLYSDVACPGSMSALPFTSCRRTRSLSAESQRTILSGSGLIKLHAVLRPNGDHGGWNGSTICSIPSYTTEVIAGRSISTKRPSTSGLSKE
jgi:Putative oxalocrotonate tautomerase enzyme